MIMLTRLQSQRQAPVYINPALIEFVRVPVREDRVGRQTEDGGSELGTVSGERIRVIESPDEVVQLISSLRVVNMD
jgi:uncharacterized protein YlzI (FlbEa/FlbD family)